MDILRTDMTPIEYDIYVYRLGVAETEQHAEERVNVLYLQKNKK